MEAVKYLAWHLLHACEDQGLHDKLTSVSPSDRKEIAQLIKWCLQNGKRINTILTQEHLNEITAILQNGNDEEIAEFHFNLAVQILSLGVEQVKVELQKLLHDTSSDD